MTGPTVRERRHLFFDEAENRLRNAGMALPEVTEDFPWGHRALKVKGKAFVFLAREDGKLSLSLKLPDSNAIALSMPFVAPTGYGLGRSGWVTATFTSPSDVPMPVLLSWLEESYRAVAPRRLSRLLQPQDHDLEASVPKVRETPTRPARSRRRRPA